MGKTSDNDAVPPPNDETRDDPCFLEHEGMNEAVVSSTRAPLCDQAHVENTANAWGELWEEMATYTEPLVDIAAEPFSQLLPWAITRACESFPLNTGLGGDNIAPRAVLRLSTEAIESLAVLFMVFEGLGTWAKVLELVIIVLLPKTDGGRRPIGLFFTTIRIWMRARVADIRAWEQANALPSIFGGANMGAQKAAWQVAFTAEAAALTKVDFAGSLIDLVKAFETVPHHILAAVARALGYPIVLLRLCLKAYRFPRTVGIDGNYSRTIVATRGITAGSGSATSELRVLLFGMMNELHERWALKLTVKLYVDDLTLAASGATQQMVA